VVKPLTVVVVAAAVAVAVAAVVVEAKNKRLDRLIKKRSVLQNVFLLPGM
jgi:hypothetical protein